MTQLFRRLSGNPIAGHEQPHRHRSTPAELINRDIVIRRQIKRIINNFQNWKVFGQNCLAIARPQSLLLISLLNKELFSSFSATVQGLKIFNFCLFKLWLLTSTCLTEKIKLWYSWFIPHNKARERIQEIENSKHPAGNWGKYHNFYIFLRSQNNYFPFKW